MLLKGRSESDELLILRSLNARMKLSEKDKNYYKYLEKGYEGEVKFDEMLLEKLNEERYVINDLLLEINGQYFQIDTLLLCQGVIYLIDIKNFEGNLNYDSDRLYSSSTNREYRNPVIQLKRSETLFRQLLQKLKFSFLVDSSCVFINPEFTLYHAPIDQPFILPTQVNQFLLELNRTPSKLNDEHKMLARKLVSLHQTKYPFTKLPEYRYEDLQKGVFCKKCSSFFMNVGRNALTCKKCGNRETLESAVMRAVSEFRLLFPHRKITTRNIFEWCNLEVHMETIARILRKNFVSKGATRSTYFV